MPDLSHTFIPALIRRFHETRIKRAEKVVIWGTGKPMREFLYVDDMAEASVLVMNLDRVIYDAHTKPMQSHINVGSGKDVTIRQLAETIVKTTGFQGELVFDTSKPDGTPRKLLDISNLAGMGWKAQIGLTEGLKKIYADFVMREKV